MALLEKQAAEEKLSVGNASLWNEHFTTQHSEGRLAFIPIECLDAFFESDSRYVQGIQLDVATNPWTGADSEGLYVNPWTIGKEEKPPPHWHVIFQTGQRLKLADNVLPENEVLRVGETTDLMVYSQRKMAASRCAPCRGPAAVCPISFQTVKDKFALYQDALTRKEEQARLDAQAVDAAAASGKAVEGVASVGVVKTNSRLQALQAITPAAAIMAQKAQAAALKKQQKEKGKGGKGAGGKGGGGKGHGGQGEGGGRKSLGAASAASARASDCGDSVFEDGSVLMMSPGDFGGRSDVEGGIGDDAQKKLKQDENRFPLEEIAEGAPPGHKERWVWPLDSHSIPPLQFRCFTSLQPAPDVISDSDYDYDYTI